MVARPENADPRWVVVMPAMGVPASGTEDGPSSDQPTLQWPRFALQNLRCPGRSQRLCLVVYDPVDHIRHVVEYSCARCREIYLGVVVASGSRVLGTVMRSAAAPRGPE